MYDVEAINVLFTHLFDQAPAFALRFAANDSLPPLQKKVVGVVLSGCPAPGGYNVRFR